MPVCCGGSATGNHGLGPGDDGRKKVIRLAINHRIEQSHLGRLGRFQWLTIIGKGLLEQRHITAAAERLTVAGHNHGIEMP